MEPEPKKDPSKPPPPKKTSMLRKIIAKSKETNSKSREFYFKRKPEDSALKSNLAIPPTLLKKTI